MSLKIGIVGLPNVGKSTLFNTLTKKGVPAENYPFCTIDPSVGVVAVPDERLELLSKFSKSKKTIPAIVEFVDIAGLVKGAAQGAGLGNKFLAHIREVDAIAHVVRCFPDDNVVHVEGRIDPAGDIETIKTELELSDLEMLEKHKIRAKSKEKEEQELPLLAKKPVIYVLNIKKGVKNIIPDITNPSSPSPLPSGEGGETNYKTADAKSWHELQEKALEMRKNPTPAEEKLWETLRRDNLGEHFRRQQIIGKFIADFVCLPKKLIVEVDGDIHDYQKERDRERIEFFESLGYRVLRFRNEDVGERLVDKIKKSLSHGEGLQGGVEVDVAGGEGVEELIRASYKLLGLITFFTTGEDETRAWTIKEGSAAPAAGAAIHTDFQNRFIRAEVINWKVLLDAGSYASARQKGLLRTEGKQYIVQDGDVIEFKI